MELDTEQRHRQRFTKLNVRQVQSENHRERRRVVTEAQSLTSNLAAQHLKFRGQGGVQTNK